MHRLTIASLRWPRSTLALLLAVTGLAGWLSLRLETVTGAHAQLGPDHPVIREFDEFLERFGGGYPVLIAWSCAETELCDDVFDPAALRMADRVTRALEQSSAVLRVSSPATSPVLVPLPGEGFEARTLVVDGEIAPERELLRGYALADPLWQGALVSRDGVVGAIVVEMASTKSDALFGVVRDIRDALAPLEAQGFRYQLVGLAIVEVGLYETGTKDAALLGALTGTVIAAMIFLLTRSWQAVIGVMASIGGATAWMMGSMSLLGWARDPLTTAAPTVILVIGAADAIHVFGRYASERVGEADRRRALLRACRAVSGPCLMTTLTTAAAFASFSVSETIGMAHFGVLAAFGIVVALVLSFSLLPALLATLPPEGQGAFRVSAVWESVLDQVVTLSTRRAGIVLVAAGLLTGLCALGLPKLRVEVDVFGYWGPDGQIPRWARFVSEHLREPDSVEIGLALPEGSTIVDPEALRRVERIAARLPGLDGLGHTRSVLEPLARANRLVHDDDPAFERPPDSGPAIGELLTLLSLGGPGVLDPWITLDQRAVRLSVEARNLTQSERSRVLDRIRQVLQEELPASWTSTITGPLPVFHRFVADIERTQIQSFAIAALIVFALLIVFLRSLRWGVLAMIPNLIPVIVLLGTLGHWGIFLDGGIAMVAPIAIGIAVDDTIHILNQYALERRAGQPSLGAIQAAMRAVGRPVITTSAALSLGFLTLLASDFQSVANVGLLSAIAVLGALVADLLVLPALIAITARHTSS